MSDELRPGTIQNFRTRRVKLLCGLFMSGRGMLKLSFCLLLLILCFMSSLAYRLS